MWRQLATAAIGLVLLAGCSDDSEAGRAEPDDSNRAGAPTRSATDRSSGPSAGESSKPSDGPPQSGAKPFEPRAVLADVRRLANDIGPREAASPGFRRAARLVTDRLATLGYDVRRTRVPVPAGDSWGVPVEGGISYNVVADPPGLDPAKPYRIVGAHLDTVAISPGAEDNASGTSVMLELARMASEQPPELPVRFIAFGAEEPRGEGDAMHHFGSRQYVARMPASERRNLDGMVSLDRVGVRAPAVPVCVGGSAGLGLRRDITRAARRVSVPYQTCEDQASDHWSFEKAGLPAVRLGSVPFAGYHSAQDRPQFVEPREVRRVGRIIWGWLRSPR